MTSCICGTRSITPGRATCWRSTGFILPGRSTRDPDQITKLDYSGAGCYGWFLAIRGAAPAREPGNWQVRLIVNGSSAFSLPFTILP